MITLLLACASISNTDSEATPTQSGPAFIEVTTDCDRGQASLKGEELIDAVIVNVWQCQNAESNPLCTDNNIYWWRDASGAMTFSCSDGDTVHVLAMH
tara:strand:+ start:57 stop:350 length:294 start_codon:yes stop_codon:yes gene_type:complete